MAEADAKNYYNKGTGEGDTGFVSAEDAQNAIGVIYTDMNTALNLKAPISSPTFLGNPRAPTPILNTNDTSIATTAFVNNAVTNSNGSTIDHASLAGLENNDHPQYLLPEDVIPGANIEVDTTSVPGSIIINSQAGGGSGESGHTLQEEGIPLNARSGLNFIGTGVTVTDDSDNDRTNVTITGGSSGGGIIYIQPNQPTTGSIVYPAEFWADTDETSGGGGSVSTYFGPLSDQVDAADYDQWVITDDPLAYRLGISDGTTWYAIAGGGGGVAGERPTALFTFSTHWNDVSVDASSSSDPDGVISTYSWNWGDGTPNGSGMIANHTYATSGNYIIVLTVTDNNNQAHSVSHSVDPVRMYGPVTFTTKGRYFAPKLWQVADSTNSIEWINSATSTVVGTGPMPTMDLLTVGSRSIQMWCSRPQDVLTLNVGFSDGHDAGFVNVGPAGGAPTGGSGAYNHAPQRVTAITGYNTVLTNLVYFMAAGNPEDPTLGSDVLTGATNFSGMAALEHIETAYARVNSTNLTGCTSLKRLCFEQNAYNGNTLDLNPVRTNLRDLRMAFQNGVVFTPLSGPLTVLYHLCVREQPITNMPQYANLPALNEHWTWGNHQTGTFVAPPLSLDIRISNNDYTGIDFTHTTGQNSFGQLDCSSNDIVTVTGTSTMTHFNDLFFNNNAIPTATINAILSAVNSWGRSNGSVWLHQGTNGAPTGGSSNADVVALRARGYNVQIN